MAPPARCRPPPGAPLLSPARCVWDQPSLVSLGLPSPVSPPAQYTPSCHSLVCGGPAQPSVPCPTSPSQCPLLPCPSSSCSPVSPWLPPSSVLLAPPAWCLPSGLVSPGSPSPVSPQAQCMLATPAQCPPSSSVSPPRLHHPISPPSLVSLGSLSLVSPWLPQPCVPPSPVSPQVLCPPPQSQQQQQT